MMGVYGGYKDMTPVIVKEFERNEFNRCTFRRFSFLTRPLTGVTKLIVSNQAFYYSNQNCKS